MQTALIHQPVQYDIAGEGEIFFSFVQSIRSDDTLKDKVCNLCFSHLCKNVYDCKYSNTKEAHQKQKVSNNQSTCPS